MSTKTHTEKTYLKQIEDFASSNEFKTLEKGNASKDDYIKFLENVCRTHLHSTKILAFIYSISSPSSSEDLRHNMLEELGLEDAESSHPDILVDLVTAAGFGNQQIKTLREESQNEMKQRGTDPFMYGTLKEFGLHTMLEVFAFEWMLSKLADRIGDFLGGYLNLSEEELKWFYFHGVKDVQHAKEGLNAIVDYVEYYQIPEADFISISEIVFRENVFLKHYFYRSQLEQNKKSQ